MPLDYASLDALRAHHPAWRLLRSDHAPLVASFLHRVFVAPNVRGMPAADLAEQLEDELYALRQQLGDDAFPKAAIDYLNDWAAPDKAWLRKYYPSGSDEPQFDLTPATEKAIAWLGQLAERSFVGTESRLLTLFELLRQMSAGSYDFADAGNWNLTPICTICRLAVSASEPQLSRCRKAGVPSSPQPTGCDPAAPGSLPTCPPPPATAPAPPARSA